MDFFYYGYNPSFQYQREHDKHPRNGGCFMTEDQKQQILSLRKQGIGYMKIAQELGISQNTVKSYCRRNCLARPEEIRKAQPVKLSTEHFCQQCGISVEQNPKRKLKKFCSDKCRMDWWNTHRDMVSHSRSAAIICPNCHRAFKAYGGRKYCSHSCYIQHRFGGDGNE